ncbi:MAG: NAD(P)/FAD-dependent oxidoreductase [Deltaproteobacteria bacterium]|nr:NAD(P)/FAD-dependent oxidoreductase [Deltaproteobacteria bacterium]
MPKQTLCVIGGGAAGFFAAIHAAQTMQNRPVPGKVVLLEGSTRFLQKVRISGGGRCNVTHHDFNIRSFVTNYPRGQKEVLSAMHQFQASDLVQWFKQAGVSLKVEADGRMFPVTDDSETIIDCLMKQAKLLGVQLDKSFAAMSVVKKSDVFVIQDRKGQVLEADKVLLATGSSPDGYKIAKQLGHTITPLAPSLFSFKIEHLLLHDMQGTSFPNAQVVLCVGDKNQEVFKQQAPVLITHWGVSGPGILKISAWAARVMQEYQYKGILTVNWVGQKTEIIQAYLDKKKRSHPNVNIGNLIVEGVTKKFWQRILHIENIQTSLSIGQISKKKLTRLAFALTKTVLQVEGKNRFKDEFVECGGVDLREIDMKTMQSKCVPGLFFAGEIMDVDGITGGFNLQHAWTSGWVAGQNMVSLLPLC